MKVLEKISDFAGKWMAIIALLVAIIALAVPEPVHAILPTSWVNPLLGIVMFGMGMTLKLSDFKVVFTKPKAVITGILSQFIIMPLIAWVLCLVFQLPTELAVGVMLVGCCPGGTLSLIHISTIDAGAFRMRRKSRLRTRSTFFKPAPPSIVEIAFDWRRYGAALPRESTFSALYRGISPAQACR